MPEDLALFDRLTAAGDADLRRRRCTASTPRPREPRSADLLELMDLKDAGNTLVTDFSHGMRKKLSLAAALLPAPRLLFLDEPFEGIDAVASRQIKELLQSFVARGGTIFLTSHILEIVERLSTHIGVIAKGRIVAQGTIDELRAGARQRQDAGRAVHRPRRRRRAAARRRSTGSDMLRILRAFAWLRWRMLVNSLERTGARDTLERFSLAIEKLGPIMAARADDPVRARCSRCSERRRGYALARGEPGTDSSRCGALYSDRRADIRRRRTAAASRRRSHEPGSICSCCRFHAVCSTSRKPARPLGDVWVLLMLPFVLCIPLGMLAAGGVAGALIAAVAGVLLVAVVIGISSVTTSVSASCGARPPARRTARAAVHLLVPTWACSRGCSRAAGTGRGQTDASRAPTSLPVALDRHRRRTGE